MTADRNLEDLYDQSIEGLLHDMEDAGYEGLPFDLLLEPRADEHEVVVCESVEKSCREAYLRGVRAAEREEAVR